MLVFGEKNQKYFFLKNEILGVKKVNSARLHTAWFVKSTLASCIGETKVKL